MSHVLLQAAHGLQDELRQQAEASERQRRLQPQTVAALNTAGLLRMLVPAALGGAEVSPMVMVKCLLQLAEADGAAAWVTMTSATTGMLSAYLPQAGAQALWAEQPQAVMAGVFAPMGQVQQQADGWRLSGRWPYASGCEHADWIMGGALVESDQGRHNRSFFMPRSQLEILDTWDTLGLRATGSHDVVAKEIVVPRDYSASVYVDQPWADGALYRMPLFAVLACGVAAVGIGVANAAVQLLQHGMQHNPRLGREAAAQLAFAQASTSAGAAEALLLAELEQAWGRVGGGHQLNGKNKARLRLAACQAVRLAIAAVDQCQRVVGGEGVYRRSAMQRYLRDIHTVSQHIMVAPAIERLAAKVLTGIEADASQL